MRDYEQLPGLDKARPRQPSRATIMAYTKPRDDAPALARMIMQWWDPLITGADFEIEVASWTDQLLPLFLDCQLCQCDKHIMISMCSGRPSITVVANIDPSRPDRNLA